MLGTLFAHLRRQWMGALALFLVLTGGSAYALAGHNSVFSDDIAPNAARGADVKESSLRGVGAGILGGQWTDLPGGTGGIALNPVASGTGAVNFAPAVAPSKFVATDLWVRKAGDPLNSGTRSFHLRIPDDQDTKLGCTITAGEQECRSSKKVKIPAGTFYWFWDEFGTATPGEDFRFGWRAVTP